MSRTLRPLSVTERRSLLPLRAKEWAPPLTDEGYRERTEQLWRHPFGRERIQSWGLFDGGPSPLASFDLLSTRLWVGGSIFPAYHLASFVVPAAERGKGAGRELLSVYIRENAQVPLLLFSDITPRFYEHFGFSGTSLCSVGVPVETLRSEVSTQFSPLEVGDFVTQLNRYRTSLPTARVVHQPDALLFDWHLQRYRFFAQSMRILRADEDLFRLGVAQHANGPVHPLAVAQNLVTQRMDALVLIAECGECVSLAKHFAALAGYRELSYWTSRPSEDSLWQHVERPMVRVPSQPTATLDAPLMLDYW